MGEKEKRKNLLDIFIRRKKNLALLLSLSRVSLKAAKIKTVEYVKLLLLTQAPCPSCKWSLEEKLNQATAG